MKLVSNKPLRIRIFSMPAHLPVVRAAAEKMCELIGFDAESSGALMLSVDEALTNIIRHAYKGAEDKHIDIELAPTGAPEPCGVKVTLRDYGPTVDPAEIKSRDLADIRPGGLGVHIMNECMDTVEYQQADGGGMMLIMTKSLPSEKESKTT